MPLMGAAQGTWLTNQRVDRHPGMADDPKQVCTMTFIPEKPTPMEVLNAEERRRRARHLRFPLASA